jgi:hypothetical protein
MDLLLCEYNLLEDAECHIKHMFRLNTQFTALFECHIIGTVFLLSFNL